MSQRPQRDDYPAMHRQFRWHVPREFNMADVCMRRWAATPATARRTAILEHRSAGTAVRYTYGQLQQAADRLSYALLDLGVQRGDRVAIVLPHVFQHPVFDAAWLDWTGLMTRKPITEDHVPLLPNGKINRKALPVPDLSAVTQAAEKKPASTGAAGDLTPTEQVVAGIWESLLGMSGIEPTDNFFDLGGHSLLAAQVVVEIEKQLGVKLPVRHLIFETLRQIAAGCDRAVPA